ncbi:MAG TPA: DUF3052 domain-containing protein [Gemmatimonadales bacterium]|jgi:hypothetical protein
MAGYSGTPLVDKLGLKPGMKVHFCEAPRDYFKTLGRTPTIVLMTRLKGTLDFIQYFVTARRDLEARFPALEQALATDGMLWISWPKKASGVDTDLSEDLIREAGLASGLVDVKVCAVDDIWSGLKFVRRLADR